MSEQLNPSVEESWKIVLQDEFVKPYMAELKAFLVDAKKKYRVFPPGSLIFNAFNQTPFNDVKVVILGQDPYHGYGEAHGLCFSVLEGITKPPSLVNIFKEIENDLGIKQPKNGNLTAWARQGVLLLNATLTVRENLAGSHQNKGWESFTDEAIRQLSARREGLIFVLWGKFAGAKTGLIDASKHFILSAPHPSPFSANRGFFGCRHFSRINELLRQMGKQEIDWRLE
ncbi:MAG: uracil-DNA glycosylase [Bacteroidetes bacterium]|nr:uracil-DNA glycosylase [Bacteroidota bacterium]